MTFQAMQIAMHSKALNLVGKLLDDGFPIDEPLDLADNALLHAAVSLNSIDLTALLLKTGAAVNSHGIDGRTTLHYTS